MLKATSLVLWGVLVIGCKDPRDLSILGASAGPLVHHLKLAPKAAAPPAIPASSPADPLRRDYRAKDMVLHQCASLDAEGAIVGKGCAGGFAVFGPYVSVPANAEVRVQFDVQASQDVTVSSDVVSDLGRRSHGSLSDQAIVANHSQSLWYQVHVDGAAQAVEARLMVRSKALVDFRITNLTLAIR
jgi:hypothetical protein